MKNIVLLILLFLLIKCEAQNAVPLFPKTPRESAVQLNTLTTSRITLNNMVNLFTAGANGSKVVEIDVKADTTTASGNLFIAITDTSGANPKLFDEMSVFITTPFSGTSAFRNSNYYNNLQLKAGQIIQVGTNAIPVGGHLNVWISAGDY